MMYIRIWFLGQTYALMTLNMLGEMLHVKGLSQLTVLFVTGQILYCWKQSQKVLVYIFIVPFVLWNTALFYKLIQKPYNDCLI